MESGGGSSSDDSLSKPVPISSDLFRSGPMTFKAYRAACERTPAQPRRSRGGQLKAPIIEDESSSSTNRNQDLQSFQVLPAGTQSRNPDHLVEQRLQPRPVVAEHQHFSIGRPRAERRVHAPRGSIYELPASQDSELNRSPVSSPEPADDIDEVTTPAPRQIQRPAQLKNATKSVLGVDSISRLFGVQTKIKKRYIAKKISTVIYRASPTSSDTDDMPTVIPNKGSHKNLKKRKLPTEYELVLVPVLGVRGSPEITVHVESDPIDDTQATVPMKPKRAPRTPSRSRRQTLRSIQKNLRLPLQNASPVSDAFNFRTLKNTLPAAKSLTENLAGEGFDNHELILRPSDKRKKTPFRRAQLTVPPLDLTNVRDQKELPATSSPLIHRKPKDMTLEIVATQRSFEKFEDSPFIGTEPLALDAVSQNDVVMISSKEFSKTHPAIQPRPVKRPRRVSFSNEVQSQLLSVTAPARESGDSEDDSEESELSATEIESASKADESDVEEFEEMNFTEARENTIRNAELDDIEDEELLLETGGDGGDIVDEPYLTVPGQLARMKSGGRLNEVPEDCIEVNSSSDPANSVPGYLARYHSSIAKTRQDSRNPYRQLLKVSILSSDHYVSVCSNRVLAKGIQIETEVERMSYFSQAQHQLNRPVRRHSIVPRRHSQQVRQKFANLGNGDNDTGSESDVEASTPARASDSSQYLVATSAIPRLSTNFPTLHATIHTPAPNLRNLVRRTSQEFGTTPARVRRTPSLPFNPPFLKDRALS